ncbi:Isoleucyl-tRNA synthetase [Filomicrobium insigne]|uniref:Isoleucine--tRNA ligase n=1 Tax=Filomicrobium insigne TaxID=418854 RepID=A0A1H0LXF8_9HYPH|nr:isoleucine--tRNA ligase [Filomicrobium insigne]SDO72909.1 Isoleucyl-tRNA synthetase [Filomicrobium insigne]
MAKQTGQGDNEGATTTEARDWSKTLYLPKTDFPMKAGLPKLEPRLLERWERIGLYDKLRAEAKERHKFVLHDGPPYANGNIHIGHALNKILKDLVVKSQQMLGHDSNYVPGWDCHGLPIEWKIEEQYRAKGRNKDEVPVNEFRAECRAFAAKWLDVQREEFKRLGVIGDWEHPYSTMAFPAEATIANELMKFARSGQLYRGSKPVMWSVVEKTALAEAEVEYQDYQSDTIWVKFPIISVGESGDDPVSQKLLSSSVVIWTTTPWTIPGNRAISYSSKIAYGLYEVTAAPEGNWAKSGDTFVLADKLAADVMKAAKVESSERLGDVDFAKLGGAQICAHPLRGKGYDFDVPLLDGDHVTDDTGTGFVHTAPGHGADDYNIWTARQKSLRDRDIDTTIPFTVDADGVLTDQAPGFTGKRVLKENGDKGDANDAVIKALAEAGALIARGRLKHQYPHSWRSKKPVIFRNTPQWFIAMDRPLAAAGNKSLRETALEEIKRVEWVPAAGENRITGMIANRPDWVVSRQRAWGVPITVFRNTETDEIIPGPGFAKSDELQKRIADAFAEKGADVWFEEGAKERFLDGLVDDPSAWEQVRDVLDVWFDSGSTHAFTMEDPVHFPGLANIHRASAGGHDRVMYLEGSDQHRGWFHSSLLESCGTRGHAPYDVVLTHGFVLDEKSAKMSKSAGNVTAPQDVMDKSGADILRLWVAASDYSDDLRIGPEILKTFSETYRKMRNTIRWMLGALSHFREEDRVEIADMPELEKLMLHRLSEMGPEVRTAYAEYDFRKVVYLLAQFLNTDLSAFYFDIRKDALYCDAPSSMRRRAALSVIDEIFKATTLWLAPILSFTAEEAWLERYPSEDSSVHLQDFPLISRLWRNEAVDEKWDHIRKVRRVVTGALELERAAKRIGSSLEAAPVVYVDNADTLAALNDVDLAEAFITSGAELVSGPAPEDAFKLPDVAGVGVVPKRAEGRKCARSWRITDDVGSDPAYPDLSARDAAAMREIDAAGAGQG